jgi:hypothetical protein
MLLSIPFISLFYSHIIVPPANVEFGEKGAGVYFVDQLRDERERVAVLDGPLIDASVILNWVKLSIFLLDKEERRCVGAFGQSNVALLEVLLHKFLQLFLFELSEGVNFSGYGAWGVGLEFDGMIPDPQFGETLCR